MVWYASEDVMDTDVVTPAETLTAPASDNSTVMLLVVLVALGVVAVVGARVLKARSSGRKSLSADPE
jgi:uncharacterized protein involved in exopolysaccharide biosynthesis